MRIGLKGKWIRLGICDAILISKSYVEVNPSLICALTTFWSTTTNTFHFGEAFMTSIMLDITALLGLTPYGIQIHQKMTAFNTFKLVTNSPKLEYRQIYQMYNRGTEPITFEEECNFYLYCFKENHYLLPSNSSGPC